ncbi:MAG: DUF5651 domain-containing protein [Filifactoraceae bacterium]
MKNYLSSRERDDLVILMHLMSDSQRLLECGVLDGKDKGDLKRIITFGKKILINVNGRLNKEAFRALRNVMDKSRVLLDVYGNTDLYSKKKSTQIDAAYEENREYFKIVELVMHYNCKECTKECTDCEFYKEFEEQQIPEFQEGIEATGKCKYSYKFE